MARKPKPITCRNCGKELTVQTARKRIREKSGIWYYCDEKCNLEYFGLPVPVEEKVDESTAQ